MLRALLSLGEQWGCCVAAPQPGPLLHKDDVVESTTSRPLHTVGTYGEAEPGQEGSSQGWVGVWQQHPPASHGSGTQGAGVEGAQDGHIPPGVSIVPGAKAESASGSDRSLGAAESPLLGWRVALSPQQ